MDFSYSDEQVMLQQTVADGYVLNGLKQFVQDGSPANLYIVAARSGDGVQLALVERDRPGVSVRQHGDLLATVAELRLDNVRIPAAALLEGGWSTIEAA